MCTAQGGQLSSDGQCVVGGQVVSRSGGLFPESALKVYEYFHAATCVASSCSEEEKENVMAALTSLLSKAPGLDCERKTPVEVLLGATPESSATKTAMIGWMIFLVAALW